MILSTSVEQVDAQIIVQEISPDNIVFEDQFEEGIAPEWVALSGKWKMINGRLQPVNGEPAEIMIGDPELTDYEIQFDFSNAYEYYQQLIVGVRYDKDSESSYAIKTNNYYYYCYFDYPDGSEMYFEKYVPSRKAKVKMSVKNDLVKVFLDGEIFCSFTDDQLKKGNIIIKMFSDKGTNPVYPSIDNFIISTIQ
jgi:hypothetical protein